MKADRECDSEFFNRIGHKQPVTTFYRADIWMAASLPNLPEGQLAQLDLCGQAGYRAWPHYPSRFRQGVRGFSQAYQCCQNNKHDQWNDICWLHCRRFFV